MVDEHFVLRVPGTLDPAGAAPLLCAGITTYSPLRHWEAGPGKRVGIVGLGGLGHMGVKFAHAFGAETVLFTTSPGKAADAKRLGADEVVISKDADAMSAHAGSFDFILDTVSAPHDLDAYLSLLRRDGTLCLVGGAGPPHPSPEVMGLIFKRRRIAGSPIGGIRETQEMLDFCARARHRLRHRGDPDAEDQRGLRAHAARRREVPLRDRHGVARGDGLMARGDLGRPPMPLRISSWRARWLLPLVCAAPAIVGRAVVARAVDPPAPYGAVPSDRHLRWHELEFYGFVHFTINTFTDKEWGYGDEPPRRLQPHRRSTPTRSSAPCARRPA